jgi:hypothetical protein
MVKIYTLITAHIIGIKIKKDILDFVIKYFSGIDLFYRLLIYFFFPFYFFFFLVTFFLKKKFKEHIFSSFPIINNLFKFFKVIIILRHYDNAN